MIRGTCFLFENESITYRERESAEVLQKAEERKKKEGLLPSVFENGECTRNNVNMIENLCTIPYIICCDMLCIKCYIYIVLYLVHI